MGGQWGGVSGRTRYEGSSGSQGWYLPMVVVDEKKLNRTGVGMVVQMRRMAVGRLQEGLFGQWGPGPGVGGADRHNISRKGLVARASGQLMQSDGEAAVLPVVQGQEVWGEWVGVPYKGIMDKGIIQTKVLQDKGIIRN